MIALWLLSLAVAGGLAYFVGGTLGIIGLLAFAVGALLGVVSGRKQGYQAGHDASTKARYRVEDERIAEAERQAKARRSEGGRKAAATRKRNRETPQA